MNLLSSCVSISDAGIRVLLVSVDVYFTAQFGFPGPFYANCIILPTIICTSEYLSLLETQAKHCILPDSRTLAEFIERYKIIQVLNCINNDCLQKRIFPVVIFCLPIIQITGSIIVVKFHNELPLMVVAWLVLCYFEAIIVTAGFLTAAASPFIISKNITSMLQKLNVKRGHANRELVKSLAALKRQPIKLCFCSNFVDNLTPLMVQNFCMHQSASLLMISGRG